MYDSFRGRNMLGVRKRGNSLSRASNWSDSTSPRARAKTTAWTLALIMLLAFYPIANGLDIPQEKLDKWDCPACKGDTRPDLAMFEFLGYDPTAMATDDRSSAQRARAAMEAAEASAGGGYVHGEFLASVEDANRANVILDVGSDYDAVHIEGAIPLYWEELLDDENNPRPAAEMAEIFGNAGISPDDSVVIYGSCESCDGISVAPFVFWAMRYLGHDSVQVLDGGLDAWTDAGLPTEKRANSRAAVVYTPRVRSSLLADYEEVSSGERQLVDARTLQDFSADKIAGAIHIDYDEVQTNDRMKGSDDLTRVFAGLDEDEPIVVYSYAGARAAMVWYALQLMGYDSSVYSFNDWEAKRPPVKAILKGSRADPNPSRPGPVKIYAAFEVVPDEDESGMEISEAEGADEVKMAAEGAVSENGTIDEVGGIPDETNESIVTVEEIEDMISNATSMEKPTAKTMGCVACFDPVALYASGSNPSEITGGVKLGSVGSTTLAPITAAGALIQDSEGEVMATIELSPTLSNERLGTWDATGAPNGIYVVTLAAAAGGKTSYFEDVLTIEIDSSAPVQETATTAAATDGIRKLGSY